ncbi:MAG: hypothetical protein ACT4NY_29885 [Pseudonocardiales bacterium]
MRRALTISAVLGCVLVLAGCPGLPGRERVTETDEQRLQVMLNLPIIRDTQETISQRPGTLINQLGWERGYVAASLPDADPANSGAPVTPEQIKMSTADAMARMRETGWTIISASCEVPERDRIAASRQQPEPGQLGADPGLDEWGWSVTAYTHVDGVSYWSLLSGLAVRKGIGGVSIRLRAPNVDDPPDLFPDRPAGLPAGSTCIEQPGVPPVNVEQGARIEVSARGGPTKPEIDPDR